MTISNCVVGAHSHFIVAAGVQVGQLSLRSFDVYHCGVFLLVSVDPVLNLKHTHGYIRYCISSFPSFTLQLEASDTEYISTHLVAEGIARWRVPVEVDISGSCCLGSRVPRREQTAARGGAHLVNEAHLLHWAHLWSYRWT